MKNKHSENSKQKIIIICAIIVISIIIVGGFFITKQIRVKQAQKKVDEATANLKNTLNGGISNEGKNSIIQDAIDYINNNLVLENAVVDEFDTYYNTKVWGLSEIKVKNNSQHNSALTLVIINFIFALKSSFGGLGWITTSRVRKIVHWTIFTFALAGSRPAQSLATSFSNPSLKYKKSIAFAMLFMVGRDGFEPSYSNENRFTVCRL